MLTFHIPFTSLGLSGPPKTGTNWWLGVGLHDRDAPDQPPLPGQFWPPEMDPDQPATWGGLHFGLPAYEPPVVKDLQHTRIQNGLNGVVVRDAEVGGGAICGKNLDWWSEWGNLSTPGSAQNDQINIQNQSDIGDWPCFSKYYLAIPLDAIPPGQVVVSATLTLHQFGSAGWGKWGEPPPSLVQVFTSADDWQEDRLTWNNAPLALENVAQAWVPETQFPGWPGLPRHWDVSRAASLAYASGQPLRLIFYSADGAYHSGKYFISSDAPAWNRQARPLLEVWWGTPASQK
jgi:hypothetical protein